MMDRERLRAAYETARDELLRWRLPDGRWAGYLSSSALSTATASSALLVGGDPADEPLIRDGMAWLRAHQNADGGWGDTIDSPSNLSTTLLCLAALGLSWRAAVPGGHGNQNSVCKIESMAAKDGGPPDDITARAYAYVRARAGQTTAEWSVNIQRVYRGDRTFAVPILMNCALAGLVPWTDIPGLPFELAALPVEWYSKVKLHVVSYALPALIGIGLLLHAKNPSWNPLARTLRRLTTHRVLRKLLEIQPENGGYMEAIPLVSFVCMALYATYSPKSKVALRALRIQSPKISTAHTLALQVADNCRGFLRARVRADGSWPIDTDLAIWATTNSATALANAGEAHLVDVPRMREWLLKQQLDRVHVFTNAAPGAWGWSDYPGSVPDADDTPAAILALMRMTPTGDPERPRVEASVARAVRWLLDLQNSDGGWPTFCKGWGHLPFDRSAPDITGHTLRALQASLIGTDEVRQARLRGFAYLQKSQRPDGAWEPLWFGNQYAPEKRNPVFGAARVAIAYAEMDDWRPETGRGLAYLLTAQNADGGWGGAEGIPSTVEETALAVTALGAWDQLEVQSPKSKVQRQMPVGVAVNWDTLHTAYERGLEYLVKRVENGTWTQQAPIGLYFEALWYGEALYPIAWTVDALGRALVSQASG